MLFRKEHRKKLQGIWIVISILMIISIILLYMPGFYR